MVSGLGLHCKHMDSLMKTVSQWYTIVLLTSSLLDGGGQRGAVEHQDKELRLRRKQILEPQWLRLRLLFILHLICFFSFERSSVVAFPERFGSRRRCGAVEDDSSCAAAVAEDVLLGGGVGVVVFEGANRERHLWHQKEGSERRGGWKKHSAIGLCHRHC